MRYLLILLACFLIVSCGRRPITNLVSTIDSTHVERKVNIRDTIINLPFYKVGVSVAEKDLTETPLTKTNGNAKVELYKKDEIIYANATCDSLELQLKLKDSIISTFRDRKTDTVISLPPEQVKYVPWYIKTLAWIGGIALLILGIKVALFIYKPKI